jgi:hypothetical protein
MNEASREEMKVKLLAAPISQASPQRMENTIADFKASLTTSSNKNSAPHQRQDLYLCFCSYHTLVPGRLKPFPLGS